MTNFVSSPPSQDGNLRVIQAENGLESALQHGIFSAPLGTIPHGPDLDLFRNIKYLPIEFFKYSPQKYFTPPTAGEPSRTFLSSGTTGDKRSESFFSKKGLDLYKKGSIRSFSEVMTELLGDNWHRFRGISLVPDVKNSWQDSSLAQMVSWISDISDLKYCSSLEELRGVLDQSSDEPIWIFGTAFHFVNLFDEGLMANLHPESVIIETGGTKGKSRSLTQTEFYNLISDRFQISPDRIVSEFGMCELASQAYRWSSVSKTPNSTYRFPSWVQCFVEDSEGTLQDSGQGCLTVFDPLRIDYPWPIRTQDFVTLNDDQSFTFEHRLKNSPLKGCSLRAEISIQTKTTVPKKSRPKMIFLFKEITEDRVTNLLPKVIDFLTSRHALDLLAEEFNSRNDAQQVLTSLIEKFPDSPDSWDQVLKTSRPNFKNWLFIPPNNHSVAMIYPIVVGMIANLNLWIRKTSDKNSLINAFIDHLLKIPEAKVRSVEDSFRIGSNISSEVEALYIYGHDDTIRQIQSKTHLSVQGFGDSLAISVVSLDNLLSNSEKILEDAFSTGQRGCMSTRILIAQGQYDEATMKEFISKGEDFVNGRWSNDHDLSTQYSILHERLRQRHILEANLINNSSKCIFSCQPNLNKLTDKTLGQTPFTLPIFFSKEPTGMIIKHISNVYKNLNLVMTEESSLANLAEIFPVLEFRAHGSAQSPEWDGTHQGRPLFLSKDIEV